MTMKRSFVLPKFLHRYFWDVDVKKIDFTRKSQFVIQRLLELGDLKAVRWALRSFPKKEIVQTIMDRRGFSSKTVNFWSLFYKIPSKKIICLQRHYREQHAIHWPY